MLIFVQLGIVYKFQCDYNFLIDLDMNWQELEIHFKWISTINIGICTLDDKFKLDWTASISSLENEVYF